MIKYKLTGERLDILTELYEGLLLYYGPANDHQRLLFECAAAMYTRLIKMADKDQQNYTLNLTGVEALAYMQLWTSQPMPVKPYQGVAVDDLIGKIDKSAKQIKRLYESNEKFN